MQHLRLFLRVLLISHASFALAARAAADDGVAPAAPGPRGGAPAEMRGPPPPHPLLRLFDTDRDGGISATERAAAAAVLGALDRNADGVVTRDELPAPPRPPRPPHPPRPPLGERDAGDAFARPEHAPFDEQAP